MCFVCWGREKQKGQCFLFLGLKFPMSSRLLWASRAASYLRISAFHRGFASGIYQTLLWWIVLYFLLYVYIKMWIWITHLCVLVKMVDLWFFDQNIGFWKWAVFFFFSLVSYLVTKFWFLLLLRLMGSWILEMGFVCRCDWYHIFKVLDWLQHRSMGSWIWAFLYQYTVCVCVCVWKLYFL